MFKYIIDYEWEDDDKTKIVPLSFLDDVIPTKELIRLAMLISGATSKALERMKAGLPLSSKYVLNIQIPGDVGSGKTMAVSALSAIFGMPLYATTAEPDQGVEIIEGESKTVDSALAFVQSPAGKATRNGGINFIDEFIEGDTDRMFSAFAQLTEYPYHFYENGYEEVQRHPLSVFIVAWMYEQDIGKHIFDAKTNVYEQSEIKQFVDDWFEREINPLLQKELDFSKVKFEETIGDISYFIVPREWVEDYALSDVFATISLEDDIVRISPTKYDGEQYVDYDWRDFILAEDECNQLKKLVCTNK